MSSVLKTCNCWRHRCLWVSCSVAVCTQCARLKETWLEFWRGERGREKGWEWKKEKGGVGGWGERCCSNASVRFTAKSQHLSLSREEREMSTESSIQLFVDSCIPHQTTSFGTEASSMLEQPWSYRLLSEWQTCESQGRAWWSHYWEKLYRRRTNPRNLLGCTAPIWTMRLDFPACLVRPLSPSPAPQGCVMSPFPVLTHDCRPVNGASIVIKVADDTIASGPIKDNHESAYREEMDPLDYGWDQMLIKKTE